MKNERGLTGSDVKSLNKDHRWERMLCLRSRSALEQWRSQPDIWSCKCQFFCVYRPYKEPISKEMNNDNHLNLHLHDQMSGWLRYCFGGDRLGFFGDRSVSMNLSVSFAKRSDLCTSHSNMFSPEFVVALSHANIGVSFA